MDKNANMHRIVDVARKLVMVDRMDSNQDRAQDRAQDQDRDFQTANLFHGDHDQGQCQVSP